MPATNNQVSVTVSKGGPYIVSGAPPLTKQTIVADPRVSRFNGKRARHTILRQSMPYADVATHVRLRSATAPMHK